MTVKAGINVVDVVSVWQRHKVVFEFLAVLQEIGRILQPNVTFFLFVIDFVNPFSSACNDNYFSVKCIPLGIVKYTM